MKADGIKSERETVIVFDEEGKSATLWTASDPVYRQMKKRGWIPTEDNERHALFEFPKQRLRLPRMPSKRGEAARKARLNAGSNIHNNSNS